MNLTMKLCCCLAILYIFIDSTVQILQNSTGFSFGLPPLLCHFTYFWSTLIDALPLLSPIRWPVSTLNPNTSPNRRLPRINSTRQPFFDSCHPFRNFPLAHKPATVQNSFSSATVTSFHTPHHKSWIAYHLLIFGTFDQWNSHVDHDIGSHYTYSNKNQQCLTRKWIFVGLIASTQHEACSVVPANTRHF